MSFSKIEFDIKKQTKKPNTKTSNDVSFKVCFLNKKKKNRLISLCIYILKKIKLIYISYNLL